MSLILRVIPACLILTVLTSCFPPAKVPVDTIMYPYKESNHQECLVILLPGRGDRAADFNREGFIGMFKQSGIKADVVAADLHFGYYMNRTAIERLRQDVILPAHDHGYSHLWLVGISIGGLAALEYERKYPGQLTGIILLAPYLGGDKIINEIAQGGGVRAWHPDVIAESDYERRLWTWIRDYQMQGRRRPGIYLGYGSEDRFAAADRLLSGATGPDRTITAPGGHAWSTWKVLWETLIARISCSGDIQTQDGK